MDIMTPAVFIFYRKDLTSGMSQNLFSQHLPTDEVMPNLPLHQLSHHMNMHVHVRTRTHRERERATLFLCVCISICMCVRVVYVCAHVYM